MRLRHYADAKYLQAMNWQSVLSTGSNNRIEQHLANEFEGRESGFLLVAPVESELQVQGKTQRHAHNGE